MTKDEFILNVSALGVRIEESETPGCNRLYYGDHKLWLWWNPGPYNHIEKVSGREHAEQLIDQHFEMVKEAVAKINAIAVS